MSSPMMSQQPVPTPQSLLPRTNYLRDKFRNTRFWAWLIFSSSAIVELVLLVWLVINLVQHKKNSDNNTCSSASEFDSDLVKVVLAIVALLGMSLGLVILSKDLFDIPKLN